MSEYDIERFLDNLLSCLRKPNNIQKLDAIREELSDLFIDSDISKNPYNNFEHIIESVEGHESTKYIILILKNEKKLFDFYVIDSSLELSGVHIASSEHFLEFIRKTEINGNVLPNVSADDTLNFLKAYYIYRGKPIIDETKSNPVVVYSNKYLQMASYSELFNGNNLLEIKKFNSIIIYADEALPYSLDYLDKYRDRHHHQEFKYDLSAVKKDKYIGMSLYKYRGC